jgi:hypothetical protein
VQCAETFANTATWLRLHAPAGFLLDRDRAELAMDEPSGERRHERVRLPAGRQLEDFDEVLSYLLEIKAYMMMHQAGTMQDHAEKELMARYDMVARLSRLEMKADRIAEQLNEILDAVGAVKTRSSSNRGWAHEQAPGHSSKTKRRRLARRAKQQRDNFDGSVATPSRSRPSRMNPQTFTTTGSNGG